MSLQKNTTNDTGDISALYRVWNTPRYSRFIYGVYLIIGIIFYGVAAFTVLGIVFRFLHYDTALTFKTALFLCYVLLNGIIGYGFIFYRKWLLIAFLGTLVHTGLLVATHGKEAFPISILILLGILFFLFLTRHFLSGRYLTMKIIVPFVVLLLFSFLLTNFVVLN